MKASLDSAFEAITAGKAKQRDFRALFDERRAHATYVTANRLTFDIPKAALDRGTITAAHISVTSSLGERIGGVTIVALG